MKGITFDAERYTKPTTDAPHELAAAVNRIQKAGIFTEKFGYEFWLKQVSDCGFDHPEEEIKKLLEKLENLRRYLWEKKHEIMTSKGGWLTNRLRELKKKAK